MRVRIRLRLRANLKFRRHVVVGLQMFYHSAKRLLRSRVRVRIRVRVRGFGVKTRQDKTKIRMTRHV